MHIVHRDMSPPNVLITRYGEVKIVDFGLAKANSQLEHSEPGIIKGKFSYLSPEAAQGLPVDAKTDIFAVGIILWELLAGRRLFLGESDLETVRMVQQARVPSVRQFNPRVSADLENVLNKALALDPRQRYQSARDLGRDLNKILFHLSREVSSFDIAQLVTPIWRERVEKKKQRVDRGSIIGSLIDEALFEFTSLDGEGDRKSQVSTVGASPLSMGHFENVQNWTDDLGLEPLSHSQGPESLEVGNLASLEDDPISAQFPKPGHAPSRPSPMVQPSIKVQVQESAAPVAPSPAREMATSQPEFPLVTPKKRSSGGLIAVVVLLAVAVLVAVAYVRGYIAH
jgi:serine/threonine-protein kinase